MKFMEALEAKIDFLKIVHINLLYLTALIN